MKDGEEVWAVVVLATLVAVIRCRILYALDGILHLAEEGRFNVANGSARKPIWEVSQDNVFHRYEDAIAKAKTLKPKGNNNHNKGGHK